VLTLAVILDVPGHPVRSAILEIRATFSDILQSHYAITLHCCQLAANFYRGGMFMFHPSKARTECSVHLP
jgi:hypothetical protein